MTSMEATPKAGLGSYEGLIFGQASVSSGQPVMYDLNGTAKFLFDFGAGGFTGSMSPSGTNRITGERSVFESYSFSNTTQSSNSFWSDIYRAGRVGSLNGNFFGPAAEELAANFSLRDSDRGASVQMDGIIVGTRR